MRIARLRAAAWVGAVFASWAAPALAQQPLLSLPDVAATIGSNDNTLELAFTAGTTPVRAFEVDMHTGPGSGRLSDVRYELYDPVTAGWAACPATLTQPGYSRSCSVAGQTATFAIGNTSSALPSASTGLARMVYDVSPGASAGTAVIQLSNASFVGLAGQPVAGNKDDGSITVGGGGDVAQLVAGGGPFNAPAADAPVGVAFFAGDSTARVSFELRYSGSGTAALSNRRFELFDPALPGWVACPASFSRSDAIARSCAVLGADRASYVFDAVVVPLPSLPQLARTRFDSASTAPTSFQVSLPSRDFRKPNGTPANGEHVEANVSLLNYVPELDYAPPPDALVSFATGLVGSNATSSIAVLLADGGQAPGEAMLSCSTAAPFSITGGGSQLLPAGQTPVDVGLSCVIGAGAVDGTLTCVESGNLFAPQRTRRWPLRCAAASAAPTLGYTPTAGTSIAFPGGILGGNASRTIAVGVSGGANAGAVSLTCAPSSAAFTLAPPTTFTAVPGAPGRDLVLGCTRTAAQQAASLDCVETDTPGGATRNRSWPLQCPAGDLAPTLTYAPAPGALSFPVVQRDTPSSLTITPTANGGVNAGSVALDCAVSQGFTLANGTQSVPVGGTPAALTLGCTPRAQALAGTLTCNEVDAPGGTARTRSWTLDCPVGTPGPAAPSITYNPPAGSQLQLSDGPPAGIATRRLTLHPQGGIAPGSVAYSCAPLDDVGAVFAVAGGAGTLVVDGDDAEVDVSCTRAATNRLGTLRCNETDTPGGATRQTSFELFCPAGSGGLLAVGTVVTTRGTRVTLPITFIGGNQVNNVSAALTYPAAGLDFVSAKGVNGASCGASGPNISFSKAESAGVIPPQVVAYCELTFDVEPAASVGDLPITLAPGNPVPSCFLEGGASANPPCGFSAGAVRVGRFDSNPPPDATIVFSATGGATFVQRSIRINNRAAAPGPSLAVDCALAPQSRFAVTPLAQPVAADGTAQLVVTCQAPPAGEPAHYELMTCTTDDLARPIVRYALSCASVGGGGAGGGSFADGDAGDELGTSVATAVTATAEITVVGAPKAGADESGRVYVFETPPTPFAKSDAGDRAARSTLPWSQARVIEAKGAQIGDKFGAAVAITHDGSTIAVGAPDAGPNGVVSIYRRPPGGWTALAEPVVVIPAPVQVGNAQPRDFGAELAFGASGEILVGAPQSQVDDQPGAGAVVRYVVDGQNNVSAPTAMTAPGGNVQAGAAFGAAIAHGDGMTVVGAPGENVGGVDNGGAYAMGSLGMPTRFANGAVGDKFGTGVAVGGSAIVIGAPGADTIVGTDTGAAAVFRGASPLELAPVVTLLPEAAADEIAATGTSVAVIDGLVVVGAPLGGPRGEGRAYLYELDAGVASVPTRSPIGVLENAGGERDDAFARDVASDGRRVIVGVPLDDNDLSSVEVQDDQGRADAFVLDLVFRGTFE